MLTRILTILLLAFALTGAPFGMGRMMDNAHAATQVHGTSHQHHGQPAADHDAATPHFMACAACAANLPQSVKPVEIAILTGILKSGFIPRLEGIHAAPDLPPPRA